MIIYALRALLRALSPVIGAEAELGGKAVPQGWADNASEDKIKEWKDKGIELVEDEMVALIQETCAVEYGRLMHKRLALRRYDKDDERLICRPLLNILQEFSLDFHGTFRKLSTFSPRLTKPGNETVLNTFVSSLLELTQESERIDRPKAISDWEKWLKIYGARIESEKKEWIGQANGLDDGIWDRIDVEREKAAKSANPRFILRQWVLEEVIKAVERDPDSGKRILRKALQMACRPFDSWGGEDVRNDCDISDAEVLEERRFCGMGERQMLGFQCSCSS